MARTAGRWVAGQEPRLQALLRLVSGVYGGRWGSCGHEPPAVAKVNLMLGLVESVELSSILRHTTCWLSRLAQWGVVWGPSYPPLQLGPSSLEELHFHLNSVASLEFLHMWATRGQFCEGWRGSSGARPKAECAWQARFLKKTCVSWGLLQSSCPWKSQWG